MRGPISLPRQMSNWSPCSDLARLRVSMASYINHFVRAFAELGQKEAMSVFYVTGTDLHSVLCIEALGCDSEILKARVRQ
jgi:hypothetical protein